MSVRDCLTGHLAAEDEGRAREALGLLNEIEENLRGSIGPADAARQAEAQLAETLRGAALEKRRRAGLQQRAWSGVMGALDQYRNLKGEEDPGAAGAALLDRDELARYSNVDVRRKVVRNQAHAKMAALIETFKPDNLGRLQNPAQLKNLVREAFGENSQDGAAQAMAKAWGETAEYLRLRFNAAGGHIPKRADWGLPQHHDELRARKAGYAKWREAIIDRLDLSKMVDEATGLPMSREKLELVLPGIYEAIATDGMSRHKPSGVPVGRSVANRHADHRFLAFRSADDWLNYMEEFGSSDPFSTMIGHIDVMARDIALMEILGPNPTATLTALKQEITKRAKMRDLAEGGSRHEDRARGKTNLIDGLYGQITGSNNAPINVRWARNLAGLRNVLASAQLGSAAISAVTDLNFQRIARAHAGLPQLKTVESFARLLDPSDPTHRRIAKRLALGAEMATGRALALGRYIDEFHGPQWAGAISDFVLRWSGLSIWTQVGRWSFGMDLFGHLAEVAGKRFDELDPALQSTLNRYGLGAQSWDIVRATKPVVEENGVAYLRPDDIAARDDIAPGLADGLATRLLELAESEAEFAVPSASQKGRVLVLGESKPGTIGGELLRSTFMYKNFAVTLVMTHLMRGLAQDTRPGRARYLSGLLVTSTVMGALALQMKEISKGRDPRPVDDEKFLLAALAQGGGVGIFGDFLFSDQNRFGGGLAATVAGPVAGFAEDVGRLTIGNLQQLAAGEETHAGRDVTRFLGRYTPGASLWYGRLALERHVLDRLQEQIDPEAHRAWRREMQRFERDFETSYWWEPGERAPDRAPDFENALGGR